MNSIKSIFLDVVKSEPQVTELLNNYLKFKMFRDLFLQEFLKNQDMKGILGSIEEDNIETQYSTDSGIPDIRIASDKIEILIEMKISDTELTDNQPAGYLKELLSNESSNKQRYLILLIPKGYKYEKEFDEKVASFFNINGKQIEVKKIYWEDIIKLIDSNGLSDISPLFNEFQQLLKAWYVIEPIKFSSSEVYHMFNKDIPEIMLKLHGIVDEIKSILKQYNVSLIKDSSQYALDIRDGNGKYLLYFGIWLEFWRNNGEPICFGVDNKNYESYEKFLKVADGKYKEQDENGNKWYMCWIEKNDFEAADCIERIRKILEEVLEKISADKV